MNTCHCQYQINNWRCIYCGSTPISIENYYALAPNLAEENSGFSQHDFANLFDLEANNFWFRARNQLIIWALKKYFPHCQLFFEIGCGTGFVLNGIQHANPQLTLLGSDIYSTSLKYAHSRVPNAALFQMDATQIPFEQQFDLIGAFDVIEHIDADEQALAQIHKALKPGGGLLLTVPQHPSLWSQMDEYAHHKRRYTKTEIVTKLTNAGFKIKRITSFITFLLPLMYLSRNKLKSKSTDFDPAQEMKINKLMNWTLENILSLERGLIRLGINFPAGGSLLVVAISEDKR